jgi:hypothetical protein
VVPTFDTDLLSRQVTQVDRHDASSCDISAFAVSTLSPQLRLYSFSSDDMSPSSLFRTRTTARPGLLVLDHENRLVGWASSLAFVHSMLCSRHVLHGSVSEHLTFRAEQLSQALDKRVSLGV